MIKHTLNNSPIFEWFKRPELPKRPIPKIIRKLPFENKVMTARNEIWDYTIINKKPVYRYLFCFALLPQDAVSKEYVSLENRIAIQKSIKRHNNK